MIPEERRNLILEILNEKEIYKINDIVNDFNVSKITILRDIEILKKQGLLKRIHGGIKSGNSEGNLFEKRFNIRLKKNYNKKIEIAKKSLDFLNGAKTIFLDSSTTVFALATELFKKQYPDLNIVSNSPAILNEAMKYSDIHIISTGGELRQDFNILGGSWVIDFLEKINFDVSFISAAGISKDGRITTANKELASILKLIFKRSKEINLLVDSTKCFREGMINISTLDKCRRMITDSEIGSDALRKIEFFKNVEIIY